uniref:hypothetical protein n=1 Tax=Salmonella sp. s51228 TaxID=3159652 RepID=UPI00397FBC39
MAESEATLGVYYSSVSGNIEIKKNQDRIFSVLDSKKISYIKHDIAANEELKAKMKEIAKKTEAIAPQICNGDKYCGSFEDFEYAIEEGDLDKF